MGYARFGIDVSEMNGNINWESVKNQKKALFAIIRCGYGSDFSYQDDSNFLINVKGCEENKIPYGVYLYSYATNETMIKSEVNHIKRLVKSCGNWFRLGIWLDIEESVQFNLGSTMNDLLNTYITEMGTIKHNRRVGLYTNPSFLNNCFYNINKNIPLWVACWGSDKPLGEKYNNMFMWQKGYANNINGINGDVDINYCYKSIYHDYKYGNSTKRIEKTLNDIAYEVINGKWGTGEERKNKLTSSGYDYVKVQEIVNNILACQSIYSAKVTALSGLNCRTNPNIYSDIEGTYNYGDIITIYEKNGNWGKTTNGWVCLEWIKKI